MFDEGAVVGNELPVDSGMRLQASLTTVFNVIVPAAVNVAVASPRSANHSRHDRTRRHPHDPDERSLAEAAGDDGRQIGEDVVGRTELDALR